MKSSQQDQAVSDAWAAAAKPALAVSARDASVRTDQDLFTPFRTNNTSHMSAEASKAPLSANAKANKGLLNGLKEVVSRTFGPAKSSSSANAKNRTTSRVQTRQVLTPDTLNTVSNTSGATFSKPTSHKAPCHDLPTEFKSLLARGAKAIEDAPNAAGSSVDNLADQFSDALSSTSHRNFDDLRAPAVLSKASGVTSALARTRPHPNASLLSGAKHAVASAARETAAMTDAGVEKVMSSAKDTAASMSRATRSVVSVGKDCGVEMLEGSKSVARKTTDMARDGAMFAVEGTSELVSDTKNAVVQGAKATARLMSRGAGSAAQAASATKDKIASGAKAMADSTIALGYDALEGADYLAGKAANAAQGTGRMMQSGITKVQEVAEDVKEHTQSASKATFDAARATGRTVSHGVTDMKCAIQNGAKSALAATKRGGQKVVSSVNGAKSLLESGAKATADTSIRAGKSAVNCGINVAQGTMHLLNDGVDVVATTANGTKKMIMSGASATGQMASNTGRTMAHAAQEAKDAIKSGAKASMKVGSAMGRAVADKSERVACQAKNAVVATADLMDQGLHVLGRASLDTKDALVSGAKSTGGILADGMLGAADLAVDAKNMVASGAKSTVKMAGAIGQDALYGLGYIAGQGANAAVSSAHVMKDGVEGAGYAAAGIKDAIAASAKATAKGVKAIPQSLSGVASDAKNAVIAGAKAATQSGRTLGLSSTSSGQCDSKLCNSSKSRSDAASNTCCVCRGNVIVSGDPHAADNVVYEGDPALYRLGFEDGKKYAQGDLPSQK